MTTSIRTEIITIGDEILIGQTIDTNSAWLGQNLDANGFNVVQISSIADQPEQIVVALNLAMQRADLVIITGGLGCFGLDIADVISNSVPTANLVMLDLISFPSKKI